jgi:hypothetical protein
MTGKSDAVFCQVTHLFLDGRRARLARTYLNTMGLFAAGLMGLAIVDTRPDGAKTL